MLKESNKRVLQREKEQTNVMTSNIKILNQTMYNFSKVKVALNSNLDKIEQRPNKINENVGDIGMEELIDQPIMLYSLMQIQVLFEIDL